MILREMGTAMGFLGVARIASLRQSERLRTEPFA
jgi:hypothetical protein